MHTQAVCGPTFHLRQWRLPTLKKMQYYKVFVLSFDSVFQMSLPNEGFASFPTCPSTPSPSFTHICKMFQEVKVRVAVRDRKQGAHWELQSTVGSGTLNAEVSGSWHRLQGNKDCWWNGVGGWRDPQVACGLGCSKVTLRSAEWEAASLPMTAWKTGVAQLRQWPRKEEPRLLWTFSQAEHQPGFLQTVRNLVFLKWSLCKWQNSFSLFMKTSPAIRCFL